MRKFETAKIDVVLPFHRLDSYLNFAIQSVKKSIGVHVRIVAVNDTDFDVDRIQLGLDTNDLLVQNKVHGYLNAMKAGVNATTAEYVAFLDSDDFYEPNKLLLQATRLQESGADICSCAIVKVNEFGAIANRLAILGKVPSIAARQNLLIFGAHGADSTILVRGDMIRKNWDLHEKFAPSFADYGWLMSVVQEIRLVHEPHAHYFYRAHPLQMSRVSNIQKDWVKLHPMWEILCKRALTNGGNLRTPKPRSFPAAVGLAIAFPSARQTLSRNEINLAIQILKNLRLSVQRNEIGFKEWQEMISRRIFLISRGRHICSWPAGFKIALSLFFALKSRHVPRSNK